MPDAGRVQQMGQTAKEQAPAVATQSGQAVGEVAGTAAERVKAVAGETGAQVGSAIGELKQRVVGEGQGQVERVAGTVRQWADDLAGLAEKASDDSPARSLATQTADQGRRAADYLDKNGLDGLVGDLQNFARRRPGAFLGGAVLAGLVVGRPAKAGTKAAGAPPAPYQDSGRQGLEREDTDPLHEGVPAVTPVPQGAEVPPPEFPANPAQPGV
ncbi:hypothetical protein ACFU5O_20285 [Streptomyces sp. NPDC057445]|uniref:hypothetical protein n=1 Tax=Streptomyces sp. NPDC057445 TaxID=3346136 RepID=UPI00368C2D7B